MFGLLLPTANEVCDCNVFTSVCLSTRWGRSLSGGGVFVRERAVRILLECIVVIWYFSLSLHLSLGVNRPLMIRASFWFAVQAGTEKSLWKMAAIYMIYWLLFYFSRNIWVFPKWIRNSAISGNLIYHWSMNWVLLPVSCWCCGSILVSYDVFTLSDTDTDTDTDRKWVIKNCVEVFILPVTDTDKDAIGLQAHFAGVGVCIGVGQCEHTITQEAAGLNNLFKI